jgi:predicted anti-sigma-YlaC factor YlaD
VLNRDCNRESDVLRALTIGRVDDELREHLGVCAACTDLLEVASAVIDDRRALMREATIPTSGLMWWRTNMRAREEARRVVVRTASVVQAVLIAVAVLVAVVVLGVTVPPVKVDYGPILTIPIFAFLAWLILAPVAVYFAVTEE